MLLYLASYANGQRRKRDAATGSRLPQRLPQPEWFTGRLQAHGLTNLLTRIPRAEQYSEAAYIHHAKIEAAVCVKPGALYEGQLTNWNREAFLLWQYYGFPCGAYSLLVTHALRFKNPVSVLSARGFASNLSLRHLCFQANVQPLGEDQVLHPHGFPEREQSLGETLLGWGLARLRAGLQDIPILWVPESVLELVCRGQWASLLLHSNSNHPTTRGCNLQALRAMKDQMGWPSDPDFQSIRRAAGDFHHAVAHMFTEECGRVLLDHIRVNAQANSQGMPQHEVTALENAVEALQSFVNSFATDQPENRPSNSKKPVQELIASVSAAQSVRNRNKMAELQESLLIGSVPAALTQALRNVMQKAASGSTISKSQALELVFSSPCHCSAVLKCTGLPGLTWT